MGLLDSIVSKLGYVRADSVRAASSSGIDAPQFLRDDAELSRFSIPDPMLAYNQADLFRRLSWVQGAVMAVADTAAVANFSVKRRVGEEQRDIPNHPFEVLLSQPNPLDSRFELLQHTFAYHRLCRNAYWWLNRESPDAPPDEIWPIPPYKIVPIPDGKQYLAGYAFYPEGVSGGAWDSQPSYPLQTWEIVHFRGFNPLSRFVGLSPTEALATVAEMDLHEQKYNANFFGKNNAKIAIALAFKHMVNETDWKTIKRDLREQFAGVDRSGPLLLRGTGEGGVDLLKIGLTQDEMQFLESRDFTKKEIYDLFAPGLANVMDVGSSMANATVGKSAFLEFAIYPAHVAVGEKISNTILPSYDRRGRSLVGSFDDIRVTDKEMEIKQIDQYAKFHSTTEVRKKYYDGGELPSQSPDATIGSAPSVASPKVTSLASNGHAPPVKAAQLQADELPLFSALVSKGPIVGKEELGQQLLASLTPIMLSSVADQSAALGHDAVTQAPVGEWIGEYVSMVAPALLAAMQGGPGPGDDWGWLVRMVVAMIVRARSYVTQRLHDWAQRDFAGEVVDTDLYWMSMDDMNVCMVCNGLHGAPSATWKLTYESGPPAHAFCRCRLKVGVAQAAPAQAALNGRH